MVVGDEGILYLRSQLEEKPSLYFNGGLQRETRGPPLSCKSRSEEADPSPGPHTDAPFAEPAWVRLKPASVWSVPASFLFSGGWMGKDENSGRHIRKAHGDPPNVLFKMKITLNLKIRE